MGADTDLPVNVENGDGDHAGLHNDVNAQANYLTHAISGRFGTIAKARAALAENAASFKVLLLGDSKAVEANYGYTYAELRDVQTLAGMPLQGVDPDNILSGGSPGATAETWLAGGGDFDKTDYLAIAADLDLIVVLFNGANRFRVDGTIAEYVEETTDLVEYLHEHSPNADMLLPTTNPFTSTVVGTDYLSGATAAQAQTRSDLMHQAVLAMGGRFPFLEVVDFMADVTGTTVAATSIWNSDQIHWSGDGQIAFARYIAAKIGARRPIALAPTNLPFVRHFEVAETNAAHWVRLRRLVTTDPKAPAAGIAVGDDLYAAGIRKVTLTGAEFAAIDANRLQITVPDVDFTAIPVGSVCTIVGDHAGPGVQSGYIEVAVDCPSLAAGASDKVQVTVPGVSYIDRGVIAEAGYVPDGVFWNHVVTDFNKVTIRFFNSTGSTVDPTSQPWRFWLAR